MKYLVQSIDTYRVDTVAEVEQLHEDLLKDNTFSLTNFSYKTKCIKAKGEVIEEYQLVRATKSFTDEHDPAQQVTIVYEV